MWFYTEMGGKNQDNFSDFEALVKFAFLRQKEYT